MKYISEDGTVYKSSKDYWEIMYPMKEKETTQAANKNESNFFFCYLSEPYRNHKGDEDGENKWGISK